MEEITEDPLAEQLLRHPEEGYTCTLTAKDDKVVIKESKSDTLKSAS